MTGHGEKLSRNQEKAISALISSPSISEAAKKVGIGEKTLWRWLQLNNFKRRYQKARRVVVRQAIALVQAGMSDAVKALQEVMRNQKAPASSRVSAARAMIDMGIKASEIMDLELRIENLEGQLSGDQKL
jgi:hypothetical protein